MNRTRHLRLDRPGKVSSLVVTTALVLSLFHPYLLVARQDFVGQTIREVEFEGLVTLAAESMLYYLGIEAGKPYDPRALNRRIKELWDRNLLDDITVDVAALEDGIKLTVTVVERPLLLSIDYQGLKKLGRGDIGDMIDKERIDLYENNPLDLGELARLKSGIQKLYSDKGFRFAEVSLALEEASPGERRVVVTVDEGNKVKIGRIRFTGNETFSSRKLRRTMKKTRKSNLITRIRKRDVYNPATVQEDLDRIRDLYRDAGYKNIAIGEPTIEVREKRPKAPILAKKKRRLELTIPVEERQRWKLGEIFIEGNEVLNDALLRRVFATPKGGWMRANVVREGIEKIQEFYNNTGYIFAQVRPELRERENQVADLVVHIEENEQFRVGVIEFEGNTKTQDRVLRRELRLQEGMVFNAGALRNSLFKINQLEYFKLNEEDPVELDYDSEGKVVNLQVKGQESEQTEVQFGGGFSELDGFFVQASIRTRNFLGRGETVGMSIQTGRFRELFDVSYFVPWLRDKPQSVGVQLFKRDLDFDLFTDQRFVRKEQGAVVTYGRSLGLFQSMSLSYTNSDFEDFRSQSFLLPVPPSEEPMEGEEPPPPLQPTTFDQQFAFKKSAVTLGFNYDSHDSRLEPTVGKRLSASLEYAGGVLGGEDYIVRPILNLAYTRPLSRKGLKTVARVNLESGWVQPFGKNPDGTDRELFFLDRFFLGGENSIRGFAFRSIWVRDPDTGRTLFDPDTVQIVRDVMGNPVIDERTGEPLEQGFPQGGDKFFQINLEYHFIPGGPFRVVLFADAGNVYGEGQSIDLSHLRSSAGLEMRINVPLFGAPLRFIWAKNLEPLTDLALGDRERFDSFDFSIGTSF